MNNRLNLNSVTRVITFDFKGKKVHVVEREGESEKVMMDTPSVMKLLAREKGKVDFVTDPLLDDLADLYRLRSMGIEARINRDNRYSRVTEFPVLTGTIDDNVTAIEGNGDN